MDRGAGQALCTSAISGSSAASDDDASDSPCGDRAACSHSRARMPQYQLQRSHLGTIADPLSSSIRFLLATPGKPLLIETQVTIDGHPFAQSREQRVEKIVAFIADPTSFRQAEARSTAAQVSRPVTPPAPPAVESLPAPASVPDTAAEPVVPATPRYVPPRTIYERIERHIARHRHPPHGPGDPLDADPLDRWSGALVPE